MSLEKYAIDNQKQHLLKDFSEKNIKKPFEISYGSNKMFIWFCQICKSEYDASPKQKVIRNFNCPYCSSHRVNHTNCIWTTNPRLAELLDDHNDGYLYTQNSNKKVNWKCPNCGNKIKNKQICQINIQGLSCPKCSDGIKYPEKFMFSLLEQLNIDFEYQSSFQWSKNKTYDFYIPYLNCIIETHGKQHYEGSFEYRGGRSLKEEQENDCLKKTLTTNNIDNYIVINCSVSEIEYIKSNIQKSILSTLVDLSDVDWLKCHKNTLHSLIKVACDLWNAGYRSTNDIGKRMKLSKSTIQSYLMKGEKIGWCDYDPLKGNKKEIVQLTLKGEYVTSWNSSMEASKKLDIPFSHICSVCKGQRKSSGNYRWMYKDDYDDLTEKEKINLMNHEVKILNKKRVVYQLDDNFNIINTYDSALEAKNKTKITKVSEVCRGERKSAGGFKWMYKEEYNQYIKKNNLENLHILLD